MIVLEALSCKFHSGLPWEDLYADDLVIIAEIARGMCQEALDLERSNGGERTESKYRKDKDQDLWCGPGPPAEFRRFHAPSDALVWAATASSAMAASTGCTRNAVGSSAWQRTMITDVHGARELHAPSKADHRGKSKWDLTSRRW